MKLLAFCLLLGMSAQGQTLQVTDAKPNDHGKLLSTQIACIKTYADGFIEYNPCEISTEPITEFVKPVASDIKHEFAQAAQRAADETDGKPDGKILWIDPKVEPHKPWDEVGPLGDGPNPPWPPYELVDVPAVQEKAGYFICDSPPLYGNSSEIPHSCRIQRYKWKCKDTSRVLLTSEDGKKHCIKF